MRILVTGSNGFLGKNLCVKLKELGHTVLEYDKNNDLKDLLIFAEDCDFVYHLAGVNRPSNNDFSANIDLTKCLCSALYQSKNSCPIFLSSSIQAELDNDYGKSKKEAELYLEEFAKLNSNKIYIKRFPNIFGKWCNPNYNSVIATWCYNYANNLPIQINNQDTILHLSYIDDVVKYLVSLLDNEIELFVFDASLGQINDYLANICERVKNHEGLNTNNFLYKYLWSTYLTYLPKENIIHTFSSNVDDRGSFTEFYHDLFGQVSVNISNKDIIKGNHYHHTKWEYFVVVSGKALIQERNILTNELIEFEVSGDKLESVVMIPGWTHNIKNIGTEKLVTVMYANELFDKNNPDTIYLEV